MTGLNTTKRLDLKKPSKKAHQALP